MPRAWLPAGIVLAFAGAAAASSVPLEVTVNAVDRGLHIVELGADGDVQVPARDLRAWGLAGALQSAAADDDFVALRSLAPAVVYRVDEQAIALRITADPALFPVQRFAAEDAGPAAEPIAAPSAFLNLYPNLAAADDLRTRTLSLPFEAGFSLGSVYGDSGFTWTEGDSPVRNRTTLRWDEPDSLRQWRFGDSFAGLGPLGGAEIVGGLTLATDYARAPQLSRVPYPELAGVADAPSEVEVRLDGRVIRRVVVAPGAFELALPRLPAGSGTIELLIRDVAGTLRVLEVPYYASSLLLRPGLSEYTWSLGAPRENLGLAGFDYGGAALAGFHRRGFTDALTAGLRLEADRELVSGGPTLALRLGRIAELQASLGASRAAQLGYGHAVLLAVQRSGGGFYARIEGEYRSAAYRTLSRRDPAGEELGGRLTLGGSAHALGSLSAGIGWRRIADDTTTSVTLRASRRLGRHLQLFATVLRQQAVALEPETQVFLGLDLRLTERDTSRTELTRSRSANGVRMALQHAVGAGGGFGYDLQAAREGESPERVAATLQYRGRSGDAFLTTNHVVETGTSTSLRVATGLVLVDGHVYPSRPLTGGFALVDAGGAAGVPVTLSHRVVGHTDMRGKLLVSDLVPYYANRLALRPADLPLELSVTERVRHVAPPARGGGVVRFAVERPIRASGRVFVTRDGEKRPLELARAEIRAPGGKARSIVVGRRGALYVEGLPPGRHAVRVWHDAEQCGFTLSLRDAGEVVQDLGAIECVRD
ncbi:MAG: fimbria/pilus outer membrane usher protein [Gammaproteobacteria bacterium]